MHYLLAKIKQITHPELFKVISNHTLYQFDIASYSLIEYQPDHKLDEDTLFCISNFSICDFFLPFLSNEINSADFDEINKEQISKISYLCAIQDHYFCFQRVTPSSYLNKKIINFGEKLIVEPNSDKVFISPFPDAIYDKNEDLLVFKNLASLTSIFKGIETLYKEATNNEVEEFLAESFVELIDGYDTSKVSIPNRKRIALAMSTISNLSDTQKSQIFDYTHQYCEGINYDQSSKRFFISSDNDLKFMLYGIEQRFYTTLIGTEKRLANSIQKLN